MSHESTSVTGEAIGEVNTRSFCSIMFFQIPTCRLDHGETGSDDWRLYHDPRELYRANWALELYAA